MKVLELLDEIEEIIDTASGFPLTGKIMVDASEILELTKEIRTELPDEIHQAQWIKNERERILGDAKVEYETVMNDAKKQADYLVENHEITMRAKKRAEDLLGITESNVKKLKMSTYDYIDNILFNFQEKMDEMNVIYFTEMFNNLERTFAGIHETLANNRDEIKDMAYRTQMESDGAVGKEVNASAYYDEEE
jgi:vacuolar-type H+-ATPase subunit H